MLAHIRQVHGIDPVGDLARAPQVLPLDTGRGDARLFLTRLVQRPDHQAAPPPATEAGFIQPGYREPPDHAHRRERVPCRAAEQPLRPVRRTVSRVLGDRPAIASRQPADQRAEVLARLQPRLGPGEARSQQNQQFPALPRTQARPYPRSRSRLRFCCSHKPHDRGAAAMRKPGLTPVSLRYPSSRPEWLLPY